MPTHTPGLLPLGVEWKLSMKVATVGQCVNATSSTIAGSNSSQAWMAGWLVLSETRAGGRPPAGLPPEGGGAACPASAGTTLTCTYAAAGRLRVGRPASPGPAS